MDRKLRKRIKTNQLNIINRGEIPLLFNFKAFRMIGIICLTILIICLIGMGVEYIIKSWKK